MRNLFLYILLVSAITACGGNGVIIAPTPTFPTVPGLIEAEAFTAFEDSTTDHSGDCGSGPVDQELTQDESGTCNIAWTVADEWLEYDIQVSEAGNYDIVLRLASKSEGNSIGISLDGNDIGTVMSPSAGWQSWEDRVIYSVSLTEGQHTLRTTFLNDDINFNWLKVEEASDNPPIDYTYVGGGGTVAGALPHSCETPPGFTVVDSLSAMISAMNNSDVNVALAPGNYSVDTDDTGFFTNQDFGNSKVTSTLLGVNGSNSHYDFRCTKIIFDTKLWQEFGGNEVIQLRTLGNDNVISNLNIEDIGDTSPSGGALNVVMDGRDNTLQGSVITARGAQPYGLGDAYGKGGGSVLNHQKHSVVLIRGLRNTLKQSTVFNYSYGHSVFTQAAEDTLIDGVYIQGELRSTADMLAANNSRFTAADERAAGVDFITIWGYKLPTGYWMSLQEAGIRAYNAGNTLIDGVEYSRGTTDIAVLNSVIRNTRTAVGLHQASGSTYIENTTSIGCESGFGIGSGGEIIDSYADADIGPALSLGNSGATVDITILPTDSSRNGSGEVAYISGNNHNVTLRSNQSDVDQNLKVILSGDNNSVRHQDGGTLAYQDNATLENSEVNNLTNFPMIINDLAEDNTGQSDGSISGSIDTNSIQQN